MLSKNNLLEEMVAQTKITKKMTEKQKKIVETAVKMFAEKGYANTSTSEIAKAAGVAEGTIFRHYGTKDNLLLAILLSFIKESLPTMADNVFQEVFSEDKSFEDFLRAFIINRGQFLEDNKELFQVIVKELLYSEELKSELLPLFTDEVLKRLKAVIDHYKRRGELIDIPSDEIVRMMFTTLAGYFVTEFVLFSKPSPKGKEEEIEKLIGFILNGIKKESTSDL